MMNPDKMNLQLFFPFNNYNWNNTVIEKNMIDVEWMKDSLRAKFKKTISGSHIYREAYRHDPEYAYYFV
jgi:D-serine dehydratase